MTGLSVIVPLLNEVEVLPKLVANLALIDAEQVVIVDGGSSDGSWQWLKEQWLTNDSLDGYTRLLVQSTAGRAQQMNAGAARANQAMLLFMHADTRLPAGAKALVCAASHQLSWGRFNISFDSNHLGMRLVAFFMNIRSSVTGIATGDQAIFAHQNLFQKVHGFDDLSLMEDIAISKKLRRVSKPRCLKSKAITSARRWKQNGIVRTVIRMWWYRWLFFLGVSPDRFVNKYRDVR